MSRYDCDVAIAGGGLVGATLAAALRRWPLSVTVIDPGRGGGGDGGRGDGDGGDGGGRGRGGGDADARTLALSYGSARLYRTLGRWEEIGCDAAPIREVHVSRRGRFGFTRIRAGECGVEALGYVVPARSLQRRLNEALDSGSGAAAGTGTGSGADSGAAARAARAGKAVFVRIRAEVEAVEVHGGNAMVEARGPDGPVSVAARLVVGADGAGSAVRRAAGLPLRVHRCDHVALAGDFTPERPHRGRAFERFTERGPLAVLPLDEERCGFVWTVPESAEEEAAEDGFDGPGLGARLADVFGSRLGELRGVERRLRHPLRVCHAPRVTAPRTVLVGNAANTLHPVGAQGFNLGLRDVGALARLLGEASTAGADPASVLARYAAERRADHVMARLLTGSLLRIHGARVPPLPALGAAGLFALDRLGPVKRVFAKIAMGDGWGAGRDAGAGAGTDTDAGAGLRRAWRDKWRDEAADPARAG